MNISGNSRAHWRKSSYSSANGQCVEVADLHGTVAVRDSRQPAGAMLSLTPRQWRDFLAHVRRAS